MIVSPLLITLPEVNMIQPSVLTWMFSLVSPLLRVAADESVVWLLGEEPDGQLAKWSPLCPEAGAVMEPVTHTCVDDEQDAVSVPPV